MEKCKVIAVTNQKGGVGKTTTTVNLGVGLAQQGKKVLLVDTDPQGSLTVSLGVKNPDELDTTISDLMQVVVDNGNLSPLDRGILKDIEGIDLVPSNIGLSSFEVSLVNTMSREFVLRSYLGAVKRDYDYVLIDCMPSLGMLTINALAAADSVLIPCQANYLSTKGLKLLMGSVAKVRRQINPELKIDGILLTMVDSRTNNAKSIIAALRQTGSNLRVLNTEIPFSVRAAELAELPTVLCIVRELTDNGAVIIMVDSNLQREQVLPSEKAFAYKMKLDAMKRQVGRPSKENGATVLPHFSGKKSRELLAE